jgi:hypothetical protein
MAADEKAGRGGKARDQGHQGRGAEAEGARSPMGWGFPCPSLNLGTDLHLRSIPERSGQNLDPTP